MWILNKILSLAGLSIGKVAMYAGLAVTGLVAIASVFFSVRKAGRDAERVAHQKSRLEAVAESRKLDREFSTMDSQRIRERAARWQK